MSGPLQTPRNALVLALALGACSAPTGTLAITTGGESDTFSRAPAPTSLLVESVDSAGTHTTLAQTALPVGTLDLGSQSDANVLSFQVTGKDDAGDVLVYGATLPVQLSVISSAALPVFVQRVGETARMPGTLCDARPAPLVAAAGRSLIVAGGKDATSQEQVCGYDLAILQSIGSVLGIDRAPRSMALAPDASSPAALLVDDAGATVLDLAQGTQQDLDPPKGGTYADVSGGATIVGEDGASWIVGSTRDSDAASALVLHLDPAGTASFVTLSAPRARAAAAWSPGRGLVVVGGSDAAPGGELVPTGGTATVALPYPPDATTGAVATSLDSSTVLLVGGHDTQGASVAPRTLDLGCSIDCKPKAWGQPPAAAITATGLFTVAPGVAVLVGDDLSGSTHVFRMDAKATTEVPLKIPRAQARALLLATGALAIVGGGSDVIESFYPGRM